MKKKLASIPSIPSIILILTAGSCEKDDAALARSGGRTIETADFFARFVSHRRQTGLPDNGQTRMKILQRMVDDELMIQEARRRGLASGLVGARYCYRMT